MQLLGCFPSFSFPSFYSPLALAALLPTVSLSLLYFPFSDIPSTSSSLFSFLFLMHLFIYSSSFCFSLTLSSSFCSSSSCFSGASSFSFSYASSFLSSSSYSSCSFFSSSSSCSCLDAQLPELILSLCNLCKFLQLSKGAGRAGGVAGARPVAEA